MTEAQVSCTLATTEDGQDMVVIRVPVRDAIYEDPAALQSVAKQVINQVLEKLNDARDDNVFIVPHMQSIALHQGKRAMKIHVPYTLTEVRLRSNDGGPNRVEVSGDGVSDEAKGIVERVGEEFLKNM